MNPAVRSALDATPAPVGFSIPTIADLRGADAVLVVEAHWWLRSRSTARWLRLPVADLDGLNAASRVRVVEDALDRLDALPALHAYIPPIKHL